jgi:hypothetical protein
MATAGSANQPANPFDKELPAAALRWSTTVDSKELDYGQIHTIIYRDIAMGNDYRKERIKLLTALATGVFALTVTFHKDLFGSTLTTTGLVFLLLGWAALIVSLVAGIFHFRAWEDFYLEHRAQGNAIWRHHTESDVSEKKASRIAFYESKATIQQLQQSYKKWNCMQSGGLVIGLILIAIYVAITGFAVVSARSTTSAASAATAAPATAAPATGSAPAADPPGSKKGAPPKQD